MVPGYQGWYQYTRVGTKIPGPGWYQDVRQIILFYYGAAAPGISKKKVSDRGDGFYLSRAIILFVQKYCSYMYPKQLSMAAGKKSAFTVCVISVVYPENGQSRSRNFQDMGLFT